MKKTVDINFSNFIVNENSSEKYEFIGEGSLEVIDDFTLIKFKDEDSNALIELYFKSNHIILKKIDFNVKSMLEFIPDRDVINYYQTPYGELKLITKVVSYKYELNKIHLIYTLLNEKSKIGDYQLRIQYKEREDEYKYC
ncbi:TPA: DUF1934 family protein [bacterium]|nr:DUF1934 family protein [bacterium]